MINPWRMKIKLPCPECEGKGETKRDDCVYSMPCNFCESTGKVLQEVDPKDIELSADKLDSKAFRCVCGKPENILRPYLGQIPHSWMQWGDALVCGDCKTEVLLSCAMAAAEKVQQIKDNKRGDSK